MGITGIKWKKKRTERDVKLNGIIALSKDEAAFIHMTLTELEKIAENDRDVKISIHILEKAMS